MNATVTSSAVTPHASATHVPNTSVITNGISEEKRKNGKIVKYRKQSKKTFSSQLSDQIQQCNAVSVAEVGGEDYRKYDLEELSTMCIGIEKEVSLHTTTSKQKTYLYNG